MTGRESLLTAILDCGTADLSLLDDVQYDWGDIFKRLEDDAHDLNSVMREVFQVGYEDIQVAVDDRICELEAIELNGRELDDDEADELALLRELDASEDFDSFHNYLDTHVWCRNHADTYKKYMTEALEEFEENTGFCIGLE